MAKPNCMDNHDYYQIMGLERTANQDEIKRAYRRLARKFHPDVSKEANAEAQFKQVAEAYEVLKDPKKRKLYDTYGKQWQQVKDNPNQQPHQSHGTPPPDFEDLFKDLFRKRQRHQYYDKGQDIHAKINIELEEAYRGDKKSFQIQLPAMTSDGQLDYRSKTIQVKIPAGVKDKQVIRLKGQGAQLENGLHGDLYLEIHINPHNLFQLSHENIELTLPITPWEAALGDTVTVPTLGGNVALKIPKGSQSGRKLRLKGRGLPGDPPGDQVVHLEIVIPPDSNPSMQKYYQKLAEASDYNPRQAMGVTHD